MKTLTVTQIHNLVGELFNETDLVIQAAPNNKYPPLVKHSMVEGAALIVAKLKEALADK